MRGSIAWALGLALGAVAGAGLTGGTAAAGADEAGTRKKVPSVEREQPGAGEEQAQRELERDARHIERRVVRRLHDAAGGYLGVTLAEVDREAVARLSLGEEQGALVTRVHENTPAAKAGLQADDVIVKYQGEPVRSAMQFRRLVHETPPGRGVALEVLRDGRAQTLSVEIGRRELAHFDVRIPELHGDLPSPEELGKLGELGKDLDLDLDLGEAPDVRVFRLPGRDRLMLRGLTPGFAPPRRLALRYQEIGGQLADYFQLEHDSGVLVAEVDEDGPAAKAGVQAGDVILSVGDKQIRDGSDLRAALEGTEAGQEVGLKVSRKGQVLDLKVTLGGRERQPRRGRGGTT